MGKNFNSGIISAALFLFFVSAQAQTPLAGAPGSYSRLGSDAFSASAGNAVTAFPGLYASAFTNAALPAVSRVKYFSASSFSLGLEREIYSVYGMNPVGPSGAVAYGLHYFNSGPIDFRNNNGEKLESGSASELTGLFGFSLGLSKLPVVIGVNLKYRYASLYKDIPATSGFGIDAGILWKTRWPGLLIGFSVQDLNTQYRWDTKEIYDENANTTLDYFPVRYRLGASYDLSRFSIKLLGEYEHWTYRTQARSFSVTEGNFPVSKLSTENEVENSGNMLRFGGIWTPVESFSFRAGIDRMDLSYEKTDIRPGFGFRYEHQTGFLNPIIDFSYLLDQNGPQNLWIISAGFSY